MLRVLPMSASIATAINVKKSKLILPWSCVTRLFNGFGAGQAFEAHWNGDSMKIIFSECEAMGIEAEIKGLHGATVD